MPVVGRAGGLRSVFDGRGNVRIGPEVDVSPVTEHLFAGLFAVAEPVVARLLTGPWDRLQRDVELRDFVSPVTKRLVPRVTTRTPHVHTTLFALDANRLLVIDSRCLIRLLVLPVDQRVRDLLQDHL